ncbi:MAG: GNAT family N-acetyltransferase [Shimia sp.]
MSGVRAATVADAPACARIVSDWLLATPWLTDGPGYETLCGVMAEGIPKREFWVIGAPVVGYMSIDAEIAHIHGFYCAQPGRGHGRALLDHAKAGRDFLQLWTHAPNAAAHRFYHREGFVTVERREEGRGDGVPELRMEWRR